MKETAQVLYERYMQSNGNDVDVNAWNEMPDAYRQHWRNAAKTACEHDRLHFPKFEGDEPEWVRHLKTQYKSILEEIRTMATKTDLDNAIAGLSTQLTGVATDLSTAITDLEDKITAGDDPSDEIAAIKAISDKLTSIDASVKAADPGAPASTAPSTPTPTTLSLVASTLVTSTATGELSGQVSGGATVPTGSVTITDSTGAVSLSATLDSAGDFTVSLGPLPVGSYSLSASYGGDSANAASTTSLAVTVAS